jgi:hypothetical protein
MVMSIRQVVSGAILTKLLTVTDLYPVDELLDEWGNLKYYLGVAPGGTNYPYIKSNHTFGGELTRTPRPEFDVLWQLGVVSEDQPTAENYDAIIYNALIRTRLDFPDGWLTDQNITYAGAVFEPDTIQGDQVWMVGGYYRIRGTK